MVATTRMQRRYDHRLRELVRSTGNLELAVQQGVPISTARGWVKAPQTEVVTVDVADMEVSQLRQEVLALRQRVARLRAMTRVAFARMKATGSSLSNERILDAAGKQLLVRAVERSRVALPLRIVLRVLQLSSSRYHRWKREEECGRDDTPSCPRFVPHQLTQVEVEAVKEMVTSEAYRHVPTGRLAVLAQRLGKVFASPSTWYRLIRIHKWRRPRRRMLKHQWLFLNALDTVARVEKLVAFYVEQHNKQLPHSAFRGQTPDEMYFGTGCHIPDQLEAARKAARQSRLEVNRQLSCKRCEPLTEVST